MKDRTEVLNMRLDNILGRNVWFEEQAFENLKSIDLVFTN